MSRSAAVIDRLDSRSGLGRAGVDRSDQARAVPSIGQTSHSGPHELQAVDVRAAAREDVRVFCADDAIAEDAHSGIFARHDMVMPGPFRENMGRTSRRSDLEVNVGDFKIISADSHINEPPDL